MRIGRLATFGYAVIGALALASALPARALAQDHSHMAAEPQALTPQQQSKASELIRIVQDATERFKDPYQAESEGYHPMFGCVSGPDAGAMGIHFVNGYLLDRGMVDAKKPQIVIYEPTANGRLRLIGADYLVFADKWHEKHKDPPELNGQLFHLFETPNRFALPAFYTLHVWAWKDNPNGTFVNWHPNVACDGFNPPTP